MPADSPEFPTIISVDGEIYQAQLIYKMNQLFPGQKYMTGWKQSNSTQGKPYQISYLNPTIETVSTAAIVRRGVDGGKAQAARKFLDFVAQK
ncbi:MAG: hypothetical protein LH628_28010 [Microcoleus sp. CAN_BIN18]|nr:hypothetical protein [Microcoleus sp. CAN_BIN18]